MTITIDVNTCEITDDTPWWKKHDEFHLTARMVHKRIANKYLKLSLCEYHQMFDIFPYMELASQTKWKPRKMGKAGTLTLKWLNVTFEFDKKLDGKLAEYM